MQHLSPRLSLLVVLALLLFAPRSVVAADDEPALRQLLDWFLENAARREAHERFWAEELVYTSSSGTRTDRQSILDGMRAAGANDADVRYSAADVDVRLYGDMAVVAFRLVATASDEPVGEYFNTGTFARRDGEWRAVAWQATRIPAADDGSGE